MNDEKSSDEVWQPLIDSVTEGLDRDAATAALERTVAVVQTGLLMERGLEKMPSALRDRVLRDIPRTPGAVAPILRPSFRNTFQTWSGWMAAAACLLLAVGLGLRGGLVQPGEASLSLTARIERLEQSPDLLRITLPPKGAVEGAPSGEILWSNARQDGVLRLKGLKPNDPRVEQFQLWIVDPRRDAVAPVDGGVFDVASSQESVIPIESKLKIISPKAFVITREQPGGVVKSQSKSPVLVASVP